MATTEQAPPQNSASRGGRQSRRRGDSSNRGDNTSRSRGVARGRERNEEATRQGGGMDEGIGSRRPQERKRGGFGQTRAEESGSMQEVLSVASAARQTVAAKPDADDAASDAESTVCFICADPVKYSAVPPCNHSTCHICSLRMRALYKTKACTHCRTESEFVVFTNNAEKRFEDFKNDEIVARNDALGIKYDDQVICDDATLLLRYNCPEETCDRACLGWPDLHRHVKHEHNRVMCDLCTRHKKVFTHEHELFTAAELRRHERHGDDVPGSENQSGFKGHPDCGFCNKRYYSTDELFEHCRDKHERCHICDRRNRGNNPQYYINYDALDTHFKESHFACPDVECLEKKFVVFENEIDLKAHQLEQHPNGFSKGARRDARRIDMSHFDDSRSFQQQPRDTQRRGGRGGRGGRDRDSTRGHQEPEDAPIRTEQQMSRAEIAFHRTQQLSIQSSQSHTSRTFGGQLSEPAPASRTLPPPKPTPQTRPAPQPAETPPPRPPPSGVPGNIPATATASNSAFPPLSSHTPNPSQPAKPTQNPDEIRRLKHMAVIERANNMARNDSQKMELFRGYISKFRSGTISGNDLVDMLWTLFDVTAKELGTLVNEVAELYEDESKKKELLKAWNNWKAINEDYPPIAGASSQSVSTSTSAGRVLKLKSSTARSSRSTTARETSWGTAAVSPATSNSFPSLAQSNPNRVGKGSVSATPWVAPQAAAAPIPSSSSSPSIATIPRHAGTGDDFPSLPPRRQIPGWTPVQSKGRWETPTVPASNPWSASGGNGGGGGEQHDSGDGGSSGNGNGKKKKGKQKQLLFHVGL